jgi:cytochrome c-type biogenesis protein CcmH/NrfG
MTESARRIAQLERELASNPGSRQFYQLGELLRRDGKSEEAAQSLRSGLAHHPRYVAAWVALGRACLDSGQAPEAVHALEQALALDAQNPVAWRLLGEAYLALGQRAAALDAMKHSLDLVPGDDVLQAAVDALTAEVGAAAAPAADAAAPPAPAPSGEAAATPPPAPLPATVSADEIFGGPILPEAEPGPPAGASVAAPEPVAAPPLLALPRVPAATAAEGEAAVAPAPLSLQESADDIFGGPTLVEAEPAPAASGAAPAPEPAAAAAAEEAPESGPTEDADLFTAPAAEEAPVLLKRVLAASAEKATLDVPVQPPASLTLARLYVQQQALGEAVGVLERLLEREPSNIEVRDLLELVRDMMEPLPAAPPALLPRERKIAALQRWLASLTLGRERATR